MEKKENLNIDIVNILNGGTVKEVSKVKGNYEKIEINEGVAKRKEEQDDIKEIYGLDGNDEYAG